MQKKTSNLILGILLIFTNFSYANEAELTVDEAIQGAAAAYIQQHVLLSEKWLKVNTDYPSLTTEKERKDAIQSLIDETASTLDFLNLYFEAIRKNLSEKDKAMDMNRLSTLAALAGGSSIGVTAYVSSLFPGHSSVQVISKTSPYVAVRKITKPFKIAYGTGIFVLAGSLGVKLFYLNPRIDELNEAIARNTRMIQTNFRRDCHIAKSLLRQDPASKLWSDEYFVFIATLCATEQASNWEPLEPVSFINDIHLMPEAKTDNQ